MNIFNTLSATCVHHSRELDTWPDCKVGTHLFLCAEHYEDVVPRCDRMDISVGGIFVFFTFNCCLGKLVCVQYSEAEEFIIMIWSDLSSWHLISVLSWLPI